MKNIEALKDELDAIIEEENKKHDFKYSYTITNPVVDDMVSATIQEVRIIKDIGGATLTKDSTIYDTMKHIINVINKENGPTFSRKDYQ